MEYLAEMSRGLRVDCSSVVRTTPTMAVAGRSMVPMVSMSSGLEVMCEV